MSMYTTAQLLAANEQKFKFDPLFLRLFFRESYPFTTEKVYLSQIPGLVNMALYVSPIVSGEVIRSRGGSTSEFTPGYVKPKHEVNPQMTLRRLPDEDPQNLVDPAYRRRRIIMQNMRDEELAIAQVEEMQAVSAVLKGKYTRFCGSSSGRRRRVICGFTSCFGLTYPGVNSGTGKHGAVRFADCFR